jgi:uncharacterized protein (TIGR02594 family)
MTGIASVILTRPLLAQAAIDWTTLAHEDTDPPRIPDALSSVADQPSISGPITGYLPFGTHPPQPNEEILAKKVLDKAPTNCSPVQVALYFLDVAAGKYGEELRPYTTAWPVRWNPVIVKFFNVTSTTPSGDTTAWCAAFVNFCLIQSAIGRKPISGAADPTYSAASSSFRSWSSKIDVDKGEQPQPGDIVVFRNKSSPGHGHVGFFIDGDANSILVLGGNQFEGTPVRHAINRKRLAKNGGVLEWHSYRTDPQLHA